MGRDNQPKHRQANDIARKAATRDSYDRILIVSEGAKTEPNYLTEIQQHYRLHSANIKVIPSSYGTDPFSVVTYAEDLFLKGDHDKQIRAKAFEQVYVVFDRDDHTTYHPALGKAASLNNKHKNDVRTETTFKAIASVPSFELWLLLHFEDITAPLHRDEVMTHLKGHLPGYDKGQGGHFSSTMHLLEDAHKRAMVLEKSLTHHDDAGPYTDMHTLVELLTNLRKK